MSQLLFLCGKEQPAQTAPIYQSTCKQTIASPFKWENSSTKNEKQPIAALMLYPEGHASMIISFHVMISYGIDFLWLFLNKRSFIIVTSGAIISFLGYYFEEG